MSVSIEELRALFARAYDLELNYRDRKRAGDQILNRIPDIIARMEALERVASTGLAYHALWVPDHKDEDALHAAFNAHMAALTALSEGEGKP